MSSEERDEVESAQKDKTLFDKNVDAAAIVHGIRRTRSDREWAQSDRRAENPGIRKEENELRLQIRLRE